MQWIQHIWHDSTVSVKQHRAELRELLMKDTLLVVLGTSLRQAFKPNCVGFIPNGLQVRTASLYWHPAESNTERA